MRLLVHLFHLLRLGVSVVAKDFEHCCNEWWKEDQWIYI